MKLAIYCAGGLGKEVYDLARRNAGEKYREIFFVDDARRTSNFYGAQVKTFNDVTSDGDTAFAIASGEPFVRGRLWEKIRHSGFLLATIVDGTAVISSSAKLGEGVLINAHVLVSSDALIGGNTYLQPCCYIAHDSAVGENCVISSFCQVSGACVVGDNVFFGVGGCIREKVVVGGGSIIGMGSFVHKNIGEFTVAYGNPARFVRKNDSRRVFKE
ncbi:MAG: sugar acetyltransferase [Firmicutes bacterium]|nr:sugar acetyltransferase [Bacillota bacterium]